MWLLVIPLPLVGDAAAILCELVQNAVFRLVQEGDSKQQIVVLHRQGVVEIGPSGLRPAVYDDNVTRHLRMPPSAVALLLRY